MRQTSVQSEYQIPANRFDNVKYMQDRLRSIDERDVGSVRTILSYLYTSNGPTNLPANRYKASLKYLDSAEVVLVKWLRARTNGNQRKVYGKNALIAARKAKYRCAVCGYADIRALNIDHVQGRSKKELFACLCANCHSIKSRTIDWTGKKTPISKRKAK